MVSVLVFGMGRLSGNPLDVLLPEDATQEQYDRLTKRWGLDKPIVLWMSRNLPIRTTQEAVRVFYADEGVTHAAMYDELEALYNKLKSTVDFEERDEIAREMGNFAFDNYISIPIAQIFYELTVDPEVVEDWIFSGQTPTSLDHIELIVAAR